MLKEYLSTLANAFRSKLGITEKINAQNFPDKVNEVYNKGKYDEWSEFWDDFQLKGTRTAYSYVFSGSCWSDITFKPKYNIVIGSGEQTKIFTSSKITDYEKALNGLKIVFTTGSYEEAFSWSKATIIPELDISGAADLTLFFSNCTNLHTIRKLTFKEAQSISTSMFESCPALANLEIGGVIGSDFKIASSPLTAESAISVITHLKNYKGTENEFAYTLTLSATTKNLLDEQGETSPEGTTWEVYVTDFLGWNLV